MELTAKPGPGTRVVLVGLQLPKVTDAELHSSLDELGRLAKTLGLRIVGRLTQTRQGTQGTTVVGPGKLVELAHLTGGTGLVPSGASKREGGSKPIEDEEGPSALLGEVDEEERAGIVLFDHDLTPSQIRNVEGATGAEVMDRTSVILAIFKRHARTREAKLQVEIARLAYMSPRLRAVGASKERQRGGIGGKGAGESALELGRRQVRDRIAELRKDLANAQQETDLRRVRRAQRDTVALIGYTNAGKSSLMRGLTGSAVLVRDQLFATLDTTVRKLIPATRPPVLVSDTVGFIKKLPHDLVASFRSTLAEAHDAALLLFVVDAADPAWREQLEVTREVLGEIDAGEIPSLLLLNKVDKLDEETKAALAEELPDAVQLSAHRKEDIAMLHGLIVERFRNDMVRIQLLIPYAAARLVNLAHEGSTVEETDHNEDGTLLTVYAVPEFVDELVHLGAVRPL